MTDDAALREAVARVLRECGKDGPVRYVAERRISGAALRDLGLAYDAYLAARGDRAEDAKARLLAELAAAHAEIEALKHDIAGALDCATAEAASADERAQTARREALEVVASKLKAMGFSNVEEFIDSLEDEAFAEPSRRLESDDRLRRDLAQDARISEEPALQILAEELAAPCAPESDYPRCLSTDWRVNFEIAEDLLKRLSAAGFVVRSCRQR